MTVLTRELTIETKADGGITDITAKTQDILTDTRLKDGILVLFCPGSTGAISTVEYEPGLIKDIPEALEHIAPKSREYAHHATWGDDNGAGHVKATILGPDLTVPFVAGHLTLGQWQQIVFIECDSRNRTGKIIVQIIGE